MSEASQNENQKESKRSKGSLKARKTAARLLAVQVVYQSLQNKVSPSSLYDEYMTYRRGMDLDDGMMVEPDVPLFQKLVSGITERWGDLQQIIQPRVAAIGEVENLLAAVLICGAFELLVNTDIDTPIIISDYLDITVGFFDGNEPKLVNGILDAIAKELRN